MHASPSQHVYVPDREGPRPQVPIRVRRKGRRRRHEVNEDEMEMDQNAEINEDVGTSGHAGVSQDLDAPVSMSCTSMMDVTQYTQDVDDSSHGASPPLERYDMRERRRNVNYRRMLDGDHSGHGRRCQH